MNTVNVHEAKTHFSRLLRQVAAGEEIVIAKAGHPVARLAPVRAGRQRLVGSDHGKFTVPEDFDAPLSAGLLAEFER